MAADAAGGVVDAGCDHLGGGTLFAIGDGPQVRGPATEFGGFGWSTDDDEVVRRVRALLGADPASGTDGPDAWTLEGWRSEWSGYYYRPEAILQTEVDLRRGQVWPGRGAGIARRIVLLSEAPTDWWQGLEGSLRTEFSRRLDGGAAEDLATELTIRLLDLLVGPGHSTTAWRVGSSARVAEPMSLQKPESGWAFKTEGRTPPEQMFFYVGPSRDA